MKKVLQLLELSQEQYDQMFYNMLLQWSESVTYNQAQLQKVISNQPIMNWYMIEYGKIENQFIAIAERYKDSGTVSHWDLMRKYNEITDTILSISPRPLIEATSPDKFARMVDSSGLGRLRTFNIN